VTTRAGQESRKEVLGFHDALSLSGLSEARFRYLEGEFGRCIGIRTQFFLPAEYSARQVGLLLKIEEILRKSGRTTGEVRERLEDFLAARSRGMWVAAVTSGKGGVGKTSLAVNLAVSLGRLGARPTIVDADLGLANAHLLLDLLPGRDIRDLLSGRASLEDIIVHSRYGVSLVPGASGSKELAEAGREDRERLAAELRSLDSSTDTIVIDTGSGISEKVLRFLRLADDIIVVVTPNVASCIDGLAILRTAAREMWGGRVNVIVNRCRGEREAEDLFCSLSKAAVGLGAPPPWYLGHVPEDHRVEEAYQEGMPVTSLSSACRASRCIRKIARTILSDRRDSRSGRADDMIEIFQGLADAS